MNRRHALRQLGALSAAACAGGPLAALAQGDGRPVTIVVPYAPGGTTDMLGRLIAQQLGTALGRTVIVDNKPGAGTAIGASQVARSAPDGTTLLVATSTTLAINPWLYRKLPYDPAKDFAAVTQIAYQPAIIVGRTDLPYKNIKEMVAYAKEHPGKINRASPGAAILTNLAPTAFEKAQGFSTTHIPFNGDAPALQALLGSQIDIHGTSITGALPYVKAGKLRVLGVMDAKRLPQVPDAPTFKEQGYDMEATLWYSLSVPAGTPKPAIERLNKAVNQVIADPDFVARARAIGMEPRGGSPEDLDRFIKAESDRWLPVLQSLNLPKQSH